MIDSDDTDKLFAFLFNGANVIGLFQSMSCFNLLSITISNAMTITKPEAWGKTESFVVSSKDRIWERVTRKNRYLIRKKQCHYTLWTFI